MIRTIIALSLVVGPMGAGCMDAELTWWGNVRVVGSGAPPVMGGYTSAALATGGWEDPRELGDCIILGNAPGAEVQAGHLVVRIGDDFELSMPRAAGGYYLSNDIPTWIELTPGLRIETEAEGHGEIPAFRVETEYPPYLEDLALPDPDAMVSRDVSLNVSWAAGIGGHRLGFTIDSGQTTVACIADDASGALTVPAELLQAFSAEANMLLVKLTRCAIAPVEVERLSEVHLLVCHSRGAKLCRETRPLLCECAQGEEPPCYNAN